MIAAIASAAVVAFLLGLGLSYAARYWPPQRQHLPVTQRIDRLLPQTQCGQCGYAGCRPYAEAIAAGQADINQCPPGGQAGIRALAKLLGQTYKPLNPANGQEKPDQIARIVEAECIGCTKCIDACPVDAIVGAAQKMHTVIEPECTGCELCVPPCPVDCIDMIVARPSPAYYARPRRPDFTSHGNPGGLADLG